MLREGRLHPPSRSSSDRDYGRLPDFLTFIATPAFRRPICLSNSIPRCLPKSDFRTTLVSIVEQIGVHAAWGIPDDAVLVFEDVAHSAPDIVTAPHALDG